MARFPGFSDALEFAQSIDSAFREFYQEVVVKELPKGRVYRRGEEYNQDGSVKH